MMKLTGDHVPPDVEGGMGMIKVEADRGDSDALIYLGAVFLEGLGGIPKDVGRAQDLFIRASQAGNVRAHAGLAQVHAALGEQQKSDAELQTGADAGDATALALIGEKQLWGLVGPRNQALAIKFLRESAVRGKPDAQRALGVIYREGLGTKKDMAAAARWFSVAARGGDADAKRFLSQIYLTADGVPADVPTGVRLLKELADSGDAVGAFELGKLYLQGVFVPRNQAVATRLFTIAAQNGSNSAARYLQLLKQRVPRN
jgi:hypothetical protein